MTSGRTIERNSLKTLEAYERERKEFRDKVIAHKELRRMPLGESVTLYFEDELTIRYQIQEMLRAERTFEEKGIQEELDVYNPLIPEGRNFKATMMLEYPDQEERQRSLAQLIGIEDKVWMQVEACPKVWAIADEDLERETAEKTSSVHFLRFELTEEMAQALKHGVSLAIGVVHPNYTAAVEVPNDVRNSLIKDLD